MRVGVARTLIDSSDFWLSGSKVNRNSLPWTPMNRRAKYEAASFDLGGEIRNRTNKQTVTDIFTPCLSACVDKTELLRRYGTGKH